MRNELLGPSLWTRIRAIARDRGPRKVAVPFVGTGAAERLPLKRGDLLVTRCDQVTVKCGQTDPREIVKYLKRGVRVHAVANLHAKVHVSTVRCIVSSANLSSESENRLVEAGIELKARRMVAEAGRFVEALTGDVVDLDFAKALVKHYRPPLRPRGEAIRPSRRKVRHSDLWAIAAYEVGYSDQDQAASEKGESDARRRGADDRFDRMEFLTIPGAGRSPVFGERVLQVNVMNRSRRVEAPARVMSARKYRSARGSMRVMLTLAVPKGSRTLPLGSIIQKVGKRAKTLRDVNRRLIRDPELTVALARLWPDRKRRGADRRR